MILGDFNCSIGEDAKQMGGICVGPTTDTIVKTNNGLRLLSVCRELGPRVADKFFEKPEHRRLIWYHPKGKEAMLDFILVEPSPEVNITDIRASRKSICIFV